MRCNVSSLSRWVLVVLLMMCGRAIGSDRSPTTRPESLHITAIDGRDYSPLTVAPNRAAVLFFVLQDCPICNNYAPLIERLSGKFGAQGARFYLIHVDSTITQEAAIQHAKNYGYTIPVLIDRRHELVSRLGVEIAPTAVVLGADGTPVYKGRIDDLYAGIGKPRTVATTHELLDAIVAVVEGKPVNTTQAQSVGCAVPDLPARSSN